MGQNQILMLILSVIIVGVAVAVGINQFGENALIANRDAIASDCQRLVSTSQQWYRKPVSLGGGGNTFTGLTLSELAIDPTNENGSYTLTVDSATQITVVGTGIENSPATSAPLTVTLVHDAATNTITYSDDL